VLLTLTVYFTGTSSKKSECSLLLKIGMGILLLKSQEPSSNTKCYRKQLFTYSLKPYQLQIGLWKDQLGNTTFAILKLSINIISTLNT